MRIAHLSRPELPPAALDVSSARRQWLRALVQAARQLAPDLWVVTGPLVTDGQLDTERLVLLQGLLGPLAGAAPVLVLPAATDPDPGALSLASGPQGWPVRGLRETEQGELLLPGGLPPADLYHLGAEPDLSTRLSVWSSRMRRRQQEGRPTLLLASDGLQAAVAAVTLPCDVVLTLLPRDGLAIVDVPATAPAPTRDCTALAGEGRRCWLPSPAGPQRTLRVSLPDGETTGDGEAVAGAVVTLELVGSPSAHHTPTALDLAHDWTARLLEEGAASVSIKRSWASAGPRWLSLEARIRDHVGGVPTPPQTSPPTPGEE